MGNSLTPAIRRCPDCQEPLSRHIRPFETEPTRTCADVAVRKECPDPDFCYQPELCRGLHNCLAGTKYGRVCND